MLSVYVFAKVFKRYSFICKNSVGLCAGLSEPFELAFPAVLIVLALTAVPLVPELLVFSKCLKGFTAPVLSAVYKATKVFAVPTVLEGLQGCTLINEYYFELFIGSSKTFYQH